MHHVAAHHVGRHVVAQVHLASHALVVHHAHLVPVHVVGGHPSVHVHGVVPEGGRVHVRSHLGLDEVWLNRALDPGVVSIIPDDVESLIVCNVVNTSLLTIAHDVSIVPLDRVH